MNKSQTGNGITIPLAHIELAGEYYPVAPQQSINLDSLTEQQEIIILLHGWLDNLASFSPLLTEGQLVEKTNQPVLAIDWPGHGHSEHRDANGCYQLADYVFDLYSLLKQFKQTKITVVGHSLGGSIAMMLAASYPKMIEQLIIIESLGPLSKSPEQVPAQLAKAMQQRYDYQSKRQVQAGSVSHYKNIKSLIKARMQAGELDEHQATLLLERNLLYTEQGYQWRSDPKLRLASSIMLSEPQVIELINQIVTPTKLIYADKGYIEKYPQIKSRTGAFQGLQLVKLNGGHHVHMQQPQQVADEIASWLAVHHSH